MCNFSCFCLFMTVTDYFCDITGMLIVLHSCIESSHTCMMHLLNIFSYLILFEFHAVIRMFSSLISRTDRGHFFSDFSSSN